MERFVEDWYIADTLGEGAYGEVKLLYNAVTHQPVAVKMLNLSSDVARSNFMKEERIHRLLHHQSIIKFLGKREDPSIDMGYLFLEYASGGELFDKIEPDVGMNSDLAQNYFRQLLDGLAYLHRKGITHRDIKPENLLLDEDNNLKITDFGLATIFRLKGRERKVDRRCGTLPYIAPEVLNGPYYAQPADVWSCGIVLVAMLTGELPWAEPLDDNAEYSRWIDSSWVTESNWNKLSTLALSLIRKILRPNPNERLQIEQILEHTWMKTDFEPDSPAERVRLRPDKPRVTLSQPSNRVSSVNIAGLAALLANKPIERMSFSQPTQLENILLNSQSITQSIASQNVLQMLNRRMTRFKMRTTYQDTIKHVCQTLKSLEYSFTMSEAGMIVVSTIDRRQVQLKFRIIALDAEDHTVADFRLLKGCGIEFKRRFLKIKRILNHLRPQ